MLKKIASCPLEQDSTNFTFTIDKKAAFEVLPVPDLTDLPGCNMMRQHAVIACCAIWPEKRRGNSGFKHRLE